MVPVLRNVEGMSYADIEKGIAALGQKAKNNQIAVEDMDGGTFTIRWELFGCSKYYLNHPIRSNQRTF